MTYDCCDHCEHDINDAPHKEPCVEGCNEPAEDGAALACEAPGDCVNGPEPHEFVPPGENTLPCFKQSWERT